MKRLLTYLLLSIFAASAFGASSSEPRPFTALVLPNTAKGKERGVARDYDFQIKGLGIRAVYVTPEETEGDGSYLDKLADCDMMLVPPKFVGRMTNGTEKLRSWLKAGGMFFLHDAVYNDRIRWLADVDPVLALGRGDCKYVKRKPIEPAAAVLTNPKSVSYGGYWGHVVCPTGTVWKPIVDCPHADKRGCGVAVARYGKGVALAHSQWQGDTTALIANLRANAALIANDLSLVAVGSTDPVAGDNEFTVTLRNDGRTAKDVALVFTGANRTTATVKAGETKCIVLKTRITKRGTMRARLEIVCEGQSAPLFDREIRIRRLFEIGTTRYRNLLSPGRRFEDIQFLSVVSPIDEDVAGAKTVLEVTKDGKTLTSAETSAAAGALRTCAKFPKTLAPGAYAVRGRLVGADGRTLDADETTVEILEPVPGLVCIDEDMNFIVDEEPFLPLGLYHCTPEQYDEASETGINMINQFGWEWSAGLTEAFVRNLRVVMQPWQFGNRGNVEKYQHNPGLMQWYLLDEPGEQDIPRGAAMNADFHQYDKIHPTYLCSCTPAMFDRFGVIADVFAPDPYPHTWDDPGIVGRWMDKAFAVCGDRNPLVCIPQSHLMETHAEWLAMTHMALCHRSKGVFWYCWCQSGGGDLGVGIRGNEHRKDLPKLIARFRAMTPALLNVSESDYFVTDGVHGMTCRDPDLGTRFMVVVNPLTNGAPVSAAVVWKGAGKANAEAKGAYGSAGFPMKDGVVSVTLKPLEFRTLAIDGPVPEPVGLPPEPVRPSGKGRALRVGAGAAYATIQSAVDAARPGDEIVVAPGVYAPFATKNDYLTVRSEKGASETIIDGGAKARCATLTAKPFGNLFAETNTLVVGFTLRNGRADATRFHRHRGGCAIGGTLRECVLTGGVAQYGGAMAFGRLENSVLEKNRATKCGGAAAFARAYGSTFRNNVCDYDGGAVSHAKLFDCTLEANEAKRDAGAMFFGDATRCRMTRNVAGRNGGAAFSQDGSIRNCVFDANRAGKRGGGVFWSNVTLSTFVGNEAPEGSGMYDQGGSAQGCLFWRNDAVGVERFAGSLAGVDPKFEPGTFVPSADSPAVDCAGISAKGDDERDIAGNPRLKGMATDAGAYEVGEKGTKPRLKKPVVVYSQGGAKEDDAAVGLEEEGPEIASDGDFFPANADVREMTVRVKFRYDPKKGRLGEIVKYAGENGTGFRVGVYAGWPETKGQAYGAVDYVAKVDCANRDGEKRDRTKVTDKAKAKDFKPEAWHELFFRIDAYGADTAVSELVMDGQKGDANHPWCRSHGQILRFGPGKVTVSPNVEIGKLEITVR